MLISSTLNLNIKYDNMKLKVHGKTYHKMKICNVALMGIEPGLHNQFCSGRRLNPLSYRGAAVAEGFN